MPIFICDECKCMENTALGHYWSRESTKFKDTSKNNKALCSECSPSEYSDGSLREKGGKWHGRFEKRFPTPDEIRESLKKYDKAFIYVSDLLPEEYPDGTVW